MDVLFESLSIVSVDVGPEITSCGVRVEVKNEKLINKIFDYLGDSINDYEIGEIFHYVVEPAKLI